ncbi:hypothetical protein [Bacillus sp. FJAT-45350]|uniref:hypothetical protein n=1 Tax=Bacillus sp. FJAT-45350 TaxID=2011014 RepID=UPI000BB6B8C5|nr:hypothetical protein [Bacillus sp. FJAT-45350]
MRKNDKTVGRSSEPMLLKQKIIYLQSELSLYQQKVKNYQNNYHYAQIEELKVENERLNEEYQSTVSKLNNKVELLQDENARVKNRYEEVVEEKNKEVQLLNNKIAELYDKQESMIVELKAELNEVKTINEDLKYQLLEKEEVLKKSQAENERMLEKDKMIKELESENEHLERRLTHLQEEFAKTKGDYRKNINTNEDEGDNSWFLRSLKETQSYKEAISNKEGNTKAFNSVFFNNVTTNELPRDSFINHKGFQQIKNNSKNEDKE